MDYVNYTIISIGICEFESNEQSCREYQYEMMF